MATIEGHRESKGATAAELNPLDAEIAATLHQQVREFRKLRGVNGNGKTDAKADKAISKQVGKLQDLNQSLSQKIKTLSVPKPVPVSAPSVVVVNGQSVKSRASVPKLSAKDVNYQEDGAMPFLCATCVHLEPGNYCELVKGPHDGRVGLEDTCQLWSSNLPIGKVKR